MPIFEVQKDGKTYEVDAPDMDSAVAALGPQDPGGGYWNPQAPPPGAGAMAPGGFVDPRAQLIGLTRVPSGVVQSASGLVGAVEPVTGAINAMERGIMGGRELSPDEQQVAEATNLVAGVALPGGVAMKAIKGMRPTQFWRGLGTAAGTGAAAGATQFSPEATTSGEVLAGPALGAITAGLFGLAPAGYGLAKNIIFKPFQEGPVAEATGRLQTIAASPKTRDLPLTLGQETGRYEAEVAEARVAGSKAKEFYAQQQQTLGRIMHAWASRTQAAGGRAVSGIGRDIGDAISAHRGQVQHVASNRYGSTVEEARRLARSDIVAPFGMRVDNLSDFVQNRLSAEDFTAWGKLLDPLSKREADRVWELFQKMSKQNGSLGMEDMITLHQASNKLRRALETARDGGKVSEEGWAANRFGGELADAVEADVEAMSAKLAQARATDPAWAASPAGRGYEAAWAKFEEARKDYRKYIDYRRDMDASVVAQEFGMTAKRPDVALDTLLRSEPAEQARAVALLRAHSPETLRDLQAYHLRTVQNRMSNLGAEGGVSAVTPENIIKELTQGGRLVGSKFWTPSDARDLSAIVAYARMIQNKAPVRAQTLDPESATMAAVSRSSAFLARIGHRILTQGKLEDVFFDMSKRQALRTVATTNDPTSAAYQTALGKLSELFAEGE